MYIFMYVVRTYVQYNSFLTVDLCKHHTYMYSTDVCEVLASCACVILFYLRVHESNTAALEQQI